MTLLTLCSAEYTGSFDDWIIFDRNNSSITDIFHVQQPSIMQWNTKLCFHYEHDCVWRKALLDVDVRKQRRTRLLGVYDILRDCFQKLSVIIRNSEYIPSAHQRSTNTPTIILRVSIFGCHDCFSVPVCICFITSDISGCQQRASTIQNRRL
jgi:hypothetical protein